MQGTSYEMLLYLSYNDGVAEVLKLTPSRLRLLRTKLSQRKVTEEYVISALTRLGCRCLRPRIILPCVVKDSCGRLYDEYTFARLFVTPEFAAKYNVDYDALIHHASIGHSMNRPLFKHLLRKRGAWIVTENMVLDSVWSYEPIEMNYTKERVSQIRGMLASSIPMSDVPYDILSYQSGAIKKKDYKWLTPLD